MHNSIRKIFLLFQFVFVLTSLRTERCFAGEDEKNKTKIMLNMHHGNVINPDAMIPLSIGIIGNGVYNKYYGSFGNSNGDLADLNFENGDGLNYSGGLFLESYLFNDFSLQLRILIDNNSGKMKTDYYLPIIDDKFAKTEHELKINIFYLSFDILGKIDLSEKYYIFAGGSFGIPLIHKYTQTVKIASAEISYENGLTEKTMSELDILKFNNKISFKGGLGFNIPIIPDKLFLSPEISIEIPLTKTVSGTNWETKSILGSLIIKYEL
jgi:hypothetical protein